MHRPCQRDAIAVAGHFELILPLAALALFESVPGGEVSRRGENGTHALIHNWADLLGTVCFRSGFRGTALDDVDHVVV